MLEEKFQNKEELKQEHGKTSTMVQIQKLKAK